MFGSDARRLAAIERQLKDIDTKLAALMEALSIELPQVMHDDAMADIRALADSGRKIEAIKLYRQRTGAGLAEAKDAIDRGV